MLEDVVWRLGWKCLRCGCLTDKADEIKYEVCDACIQKVKENKAKKISSDLIEQKCQQKMAIKSSWSFQVGRNHEPRAKPPKKSRIIFIHVIIGAGERFSSNCEGASQDTSRTLYRRSYSETGRVGHSAAVKCTPLLKRRQYFGMCYYTTTQRAYPVRSRSA